MRLTKSKLLDYQQCPKKLWLKVNRPDLVEYGDSIKARMEVGSRLNDIARTIFPGVHIDTLNSDHALKRTSDVFSEQWEYVLEGAFTAEDVLIRADIVQRVRGGALSLIEVKSAGSVKGHHIDDAAIQAYTIKRAGYQLESVCIGHINKAFVYAGDENYDGLIMVTDITEQAVEKQEAVAAVVVNAKDVLSGGEPGVEVGEQCHDPFDCPFFSHCSAGMEFPEYPISALPRGGKVVQALEAAGYADVREVPASALSNPTHQRVWRATVNDEVFLDSAAISIVQSLEYPRYYIDFETIGEAIPIWGGTSPFQAIPFQWSCHIETEEERYHREFLATGEVDPRLDFTRTLCEVLGEFGVGPVLVYSGYEARIMREMAAELPQFKKQLEAAVDRIFDLLPLMRAHYYHRDMQGKWSIKSLLPTIAPELDYGAMDVSDGSEAQLAFMQLLNNDLQEEERDKIRQGLIDYCKLDTLAMVKIVEFLMNASDHN